MDCAIPIDGSYGIEWMIPNSICSLFSEDFWNAISLNMEIAVVSALLLVFTIIIIHGRWAKSRNSFLPFHVSILIAGWSCWLLDPCKSGVQRC